MFERFTDRARRVVVFAQEEARGLGHDYIGTEHALLGLVREGSGLAVQVLQASGIALETIRLRVDEVVSRGEGSPPGHIPFTAQAKDVLRLALLESTELGHDYIGTEHILLGLIREGDGVGARVLTGLGVNLAGAREHVVRILEDYKRQHGNQTG